VTSREQILQQVRSALRRSEGQTPPEPPPVRLHVPEMTLESRIASMTTRLEALAGVVHRVKSPQAAGAWIAETLAGRRAIASNAAFLRDCGITQIPGVRSGITDREELRQLCATADVGISSADYALADTGTLVLLSSLEARMISLLPPIHFAILPATRLLTGLDELFTLVPNPSQLTRSVVLITGPSRTADIEQILVRGVHGPGLLTAVLVG